MVTQRFDTEGYFTWLGMSVPTDWEAFVRTVADDVYPDVLLGYIGHLSNVIRERVSRSATPALDDEETDRRTFVMYSLLYDESSVRLAMNKGLGQEGYDAVCDAREAVEANAPEELWILRDICETDEDTREFVCLTLMNVGFWDASKYAPRRP
jgi:hypothetical protein